WRVRCVPTGKRSSASSGPSWSPNERSCHHLPRIEVPDMSRVTTSIVVPAYNEVRRLPPSLERILEYAEARGCDFEVLVVDDGSTEAAAAVLARLGERGRVLRNPKNLGKGASVRRGMLAARGARVLFSDADLSAPIEELEKLERALDEGAGVAIGSRAMDRAL